MGRSLWFQTILDGPDGPMLLSAWIIWVVVSITLHELAHGWAAIRRGDTTPIDAGHMTLNPIVHFGIPSLVCFALTGIAWGAMPIDPARLRGRHADAFVAIAGPAMNFALATFCILAGGLWFALGGPRHSRPTPFGETVYFQLLEFFRIGGLINIGLGLFNLIPAPPLDGSRILASFSRRYRDGLSGSAGGFLAAIAFVLAFFFASTFMFGIGGAASEAGILLVAFVVKLIGG